MKHINNFFTCFIIAGLIDCASLKANDNNDAHKNDRISSGTIATAMEGYNQAKLWKIIEDHEARIKALESIIKDLTKTIEQAHDKK